MFKFFWGKGSHQSVERLKIQKELFQFQKTAQHGFPSKPTALAWDPVLRLLCIGTRTGAIKIFGAPGVEFYGQQQKDKIISSLHFVPGHGQIIAVCEDNSLQLWELSTDGTPVLKCVHTQSLEGKLKKISACCVESNCENLLIGTENGNIYVMDLLKLEMTDSVIYLDIVMQNVTEDFKVNPGAVECIKEQPNSPDHILIGYTRGLLVLWNRKTQSTDQTFIASQQLESASWFPSGLKFVTAHNDGSYMQWSLGNEEAGLVSKTEPKTIMPYGPVACKSISKILWSESHLEKSEVLIFGGGMPRASFGDRFTVSVVNGEKNHVTYDFTSKVVDFCLINEATTGSAEALVILAEEELVVIDLISSGWPAFCLPYLASLHCSAITAQNAVTVSSQLYEKIKSQPQGMAPSAKVSSRPWPIDGGIASNDQIDSSHRILLLTGHEDGSVRFWDASTASLFQISKFSTSSCFSNDDLNCTLDGEQSETEENEWPPFRKVGVFDPYSDDPRLAVKKLCLCPETGLLAVAGTAGQVVVADFSEKTMEREIPTSLVNIVSDRDNFVWKGHDKLIARKGPISFKQGFQPTSVLQLHPPAAATALTLHADWSVLAVGTAHGLTLYDIILKKEIASKCTLNPNDVSGTGDQPMSRRKSFKKSLRESFRRLRKGRSQRPSAVPKCMSPSTISKLDDQNSSSNAGPSIPAEVRPVERQIEARNTDDGMGSMVRCLLMAKTYVISQSSHATATVWAGTNSGAIYVFNLAVPMENKRQLEPVSAQLAKEIQLKHRAPVVSINIIDASFAAIGELNPSLRTPITDCSPPHRVLISSEEQFKVFTLPNLRPYGKYKLTAYTGCKVRRVAIIPFVARSDSSYRENCLVCLSNQGDFHILSLPDLRRQMNAQAIKKEDIHATSTVVLTHQGEAFYMLSSSELQRVALSARNCLQLKCQVAGVMKTGLPLKSVSQLTAAANKEENKETVVENESSDVIVLNSINVHEDRDNEKNSSSNEVNNSTIVSVEPETSFGDMTLDSVKDHTTVNLEDCRPAECNLDNKLEGTISAEASIAQEECHENKSLEISIIQPNLAPCDVELAAAMQIESEATLISAGNIDLASD